MVAKRVAEEIHRKAMAAVEEAKEAAEKLQEELAYMLEKAEQEKRRPHGKLILMRPTSFEAKRMNGCIWKTKG